MSSGITTIWINGKAMPPLKRGLKITRSQFVDSGRNALGEVISQTINRRIIKLEGVEWPYLTASEWASVLTEINKFEGTLRFYDALGGWTTIKVYWGDASEDPYEVDSTGATTSYVNCKCNIIDMGY